MKFSDNPFLTTVGSYERGAAAFAEYSGERSHLKHLHDRFAELVRPGASVLDLGCGPGHDARELADRGLVVTGCDPTRGLLSQARSHAAMPGRLVLGDARDIPFGWATFDGIWACASLLHLPKSQVETALADVFRILKPDGLFFTSMQEGRADALVSAGPGYALPGQRHYAEYRAEEWLGLVEAAGFDLIEQRLKRTTEHVNAGATGWIETFAVKGRTRG